MMVLLWLLVSASWLLAHELALGAWAKSWLLALPIALGLLAHGRAHWVRRNAGGVAHSGAANSLALRAVVLLAHIFRAANRALRLLAVHCAFRAGSLLALHLASWALTDRVALRWTDRIVALPSAFRMAPLDGVSSCQSKSSQ